MPYLYLRLEREHIPRPVYQWTKCIQAVENINYTTKVINSLFILIRRRYCIRRSRDCSRFYLVFKIFVERVFVEFSGNLFNNVQSIYHFAVFLYLYNGRNIRSIFRILFYIYSISYGKDPSVLNAYSHSTFLCSAKFFLFFLRVLSMILSTLSLFSILDRNLR